MDVTVNGEPASLVVVFVIAVLIGLVAYGLSLIVPYLKPYANIIGLIMFALALLVMLA